MFIPDQHQWKVIWWTVGLVFLFWVFGQLARYSSTERIWNGIAIFTLVAGVLRVWMLEGRKANRP